MHPSWTVDSVRRYLARQLPRLRRAPKGVTWQKVRPKIAEAVQAELARSSGVVKTPRGSTRYEAGRHYIVRRGPGERVATPRALFERLYRRRSDGMFESRLDVMLRYFTLSYPVVVETVDGTELAHPGDWIMQGAGEDLWTLPASEGRGKYERAQ